MAYARPETPPGGREASAGGTGPFPGSPARGGVIDHPVAQTLFYAILFTIPFFRFRDLPGPFFMKVDYLLTAALLAIVVPAVLVTKAAPARLQANIWRPLGLFLLINVAATLLSPFPGAAVEGMAILAALTIFLAINLVMINDRGFETTLPWVLGLSAGLNALLACLGYFLGVGYFQEAGRGVGGTVSANNMALMCVFVIPLMVYWAVLGETLARRLIGLALAGLLVAGLIATESRGGFVNLIVVAGLLLLQYRHHFHPRYLGLVVGGAAAVAFALVALVPQEYLQRQASLQLVLEWVSGDTREISEDSALDRRAAYLSVAREAFPERPILGSGPRTFQEIWYRSLETRWFDMERRPAHNTYIEVLIGSGLVGLGAYLLLLAMTFRNYQSAERRLRAAGDERGAHLIGAYKIGFLTVLVYFFIKSGIDHKYFILALPVSVAALRYARTRLAAGTPASLVPAPHTPGRAGQ
jgi:O-antigen ligase